MAQDRGLEADQQEAKAHSLAVAQLSKNSGNNPVYLVRIEDPEAKPKTRSFIALRKPLMEATSINFQAFELRDKQLKKESLNTRENAVAYAQEHEVEFFDIICPWQRVISVENLSYQTKLVKQQ